MSAGHEHPVPPMMAASFINHLPVKSPGPLLRLYGARLAECEPCQHVGVSEVLNGDVVLLQGALYLAYQMAAGPSPLYPEPPAVGERTAELWRMISEEPDAPTLAALGLATASREVKAELLADAISVIAGYPARI